MNRLRLYVVLIGLAIFGGISFVEFEDMTPDEALDEEAWQARRAWARAEEEEERLKEFYGDSPRYWKGEMFLTQNNN